jgi:hypothetical protein
MWFVPNPLIVLAQAALPGAAEGGLNKSSDEQYETLVQGGCDAVVTSMDNVFAWNRRTGPSDFRIVAQVERTTPLFLIGSSARRLADLRGAEILVDAQHNGFVIALRALLADAGIASDTYSLLEVGGVKARFDALVGGVGMATLLGPPFNDLAMQKGMAQLARVQDHYPEFPGQGLVMRQEAIARLRPQLCTWMAALAMTAARARTLPKSCAMLVAAGFAPAAAAAMLANLPSGLRPTQRGIELLIRHRQRLLLEGADDSYKQLVDTSLLDNLEEM